MRKWFWAALAALPLIVAGGLAYAKSLPAAPSAAPEAAEGETYTCPLTGEELPCPCCCPLNQKQQ
jgi:hypothetical protein